MFDIHVQNRISKCNSKSASYTEMNLTFLVLMCIFKSHIFQDGMKVMRRSIDSKREPLRLELDLIFDRESCISLNYPKNPIRVYLQSNIAM